MKNYNNLNNKTIFGFWLYIMSDCILFASLFATHAVLSCNVIYSSVGKDIFLLPIIFIETCILLLSGLTYGRVMMYANNLQPMYTNIWLGITALLGLIFIYMEIYEFQHLIQSGFEPYKNAFLSSFFTLVSTHGLHVIAGFLWIIVMIFHIIYEGITNKNLIRLQCLGLFWHFLDIIWICVFTEVYLIGVI